MKGKVQIKKNETDLVQCAKRDTCRTGHILYEKINFQNVSDMLSLEAFRLKLNY